MDQSWAEVERMAQAVYAGDAQLAGEYPSTETIERWKKLFGYTHGEAVRLITQQRADVTRERISDEHWDEVSLAKQELGYDREAYEHSLQLPNVFKENNAPIPMISASGEATVLVRMAGLLDSAEKIKEIGKLDEMPEVIEAWIGLGTEKFCVVKQQAYKKIGEWLVQRSVLHQ
ncbi:hypothetical protein CC80DRAFT_482983 [Byssothecium circinans]|uniref:Uncharacterized protein n=1 Tax=Byssothecium circinans TaxID=147558 RepID=A0A6A5TBU2_9PLEO|nr:hypothetical protein CC80DRAFT_482983 [Byssothecium circinans]